MGFFFYVYVYDSPNGRFIKNRSLKVGLSKIFY
jgi:hypothetical protein